MKRKFTYILTASLLLVLFASAQTSSFKEFPTYYGKNGITKKISELPKVIPKKQPDATAVNPMLSYFKKNGKFTLPKGIVVKGLPLPPKEDEDKESELMQSASTASTEKDGSGVAQQIHSNFLAIDFNKYPTGWPPDPGGAVSNTQIIVSTNNGIAVFDKPGATDAPILTPTGYSGQLASAKLFVPLDQFFSPVLPSGSSTGDVHIRYDRLAKRWFVVCIELNSPSYAKNAVLLAVSNGDKIDNTSSFTYYSFNSSLLPYNPSQLPAPFLDYPTFGVDENSVLIGGNLFYGFYNTLALKNVGYVIDKWKLIFGKLEVKPFLLGTADFATAGGLNTPQGVQNDDPEFRESFFVGTGYFSDAIVLAKIRYDVLRHPHLAAEFNLPITPFDFPRDISSPGGLSPIDPSDTRLLGAEIHKNKLTGKASLWTAHAIGVSKSGGSVTNYDGLRNGARWYEIDDIYSKPVISQLGTLHDAQEPSGRRAVQYFNPSIAANGQGHAVISGTTVAFDQYLNVFVASRYNGDAKGTFNTPVKATNTTAIYAPYDFFSGYVGRWGDFSQTVVDPWDDQTIWTFQEYADVDDSYGVRVVQVNAPAPAVPLPIGPLSNAADTMITLEGASVDNRGFFDPGGELLGPGYNRLTVKSTGGVEVSNVKFISPTKISFKLHTKE